MRNSAYFKLALGTTLIVLLGAFLWTAGLAPAAQSTLEEPGAAPWRHLSSEAGQLPSPQAADEQVGLLALDINRDNRQDFVIATKGGPPALVWFRQEPTGDWTRLVIHSSAERIEAGGAFHDIDGDGDLDLAFGGDSSSNEIWWWENPYPIYEPGTDWARHVIKSGGANRHHDMLFADVDGDEAAEFVYWNQHAQRLMLREIPDDPKGTTPWPDEVTIAVLDNSRYEGLITADVDNNGTLDIVGGGYWFEHTGNRQFTSHPISPDRLLRVAAGQIIPGGWLEIVQTPGDTDGMARWYEWNGTEWIAHDLFYVDDAHSLEVADVNRDGNMDIFMAEMAYDEANPEHNPNATAWLLLGNGLGDFTTSVISMGIGHHESRLTDIDADGDLDILGKPFTWQTPRIDMWLNEMALTPDTSPTPVTPEPDSSPTPMPVNMLGFLPAIFDSQESIAPTATPTMSATAETTATPQSTTTPPDTSPTPMATPTATVPTACTPPLSLDQWQRHVIDPERPGGQATFMFDMDVNGDGWVDIINGKWWYENPGSLTAAWERHRIGEPLEDTIAVYDFDEDGDLDLLGTSGPIETIGSGIWSPMVWARNDGGTFTVLENIDSPDMPPNDPAQGVAIARYYPGGPIEVAVAWDDTDFPERNEYGSQMFTVPADPSNETWSRRKISDFAIGEELSAVDIDDDGDVDLFLGSVYLRNDYPADTWTPITIHTQDEGQTSRHALVDVDEDGDLDVVVGWSHDPSTQKVVWYEHPDGSPETTWTEHFIAQLPSRFPKSYAESMHVADMDFDGDIDVIVGEYRSRQGTSYPGYLLIFENLGKGVSWATHEVYYGDSHFQASKPVDIDNDGDLDIISQGWLHSRVLVYENLSETACAP